MFLLFHNQQPSTDSLFHMGKSTDVPPRNEHSCGCFNFSLLASSFFPPLLPAWVVPIFLLDSVSSILLYFRRECFSSLRSHPQISSYILHLLPFPWCGEWMTPVWPHFFMLQPKVNCSTCPSRIWSTWTSLFRDEYLLQAQFRKWTSKCSCRKYCRNWYYLVEIIADFYPPSVFAGSLPIG